MYAGLNDSEVRERIERWGYNEIKADALSSFLLELKKILLDPMGLMLLGLSLLYWLLGDKSDSIILFVAFFPVTAVDVILEIRSQRALQAIKKTLSPNAKVIRNGKITEIIIREIVPDDILVFEEGQTLPVDGEVLEAQDLHVNESSLTGESIPVSKKASDLFYSGTVVLTGRALGKVEKTGKHSKLGTIAGFISEAPETRSPLRQVVDRLVRIVLVFAFIFAVLLFILEWIDTHELIPSLIVALTLGMSAIPEEFPMVFTLYLSMGARRLSQKGVLVKSLPSVEALGGVDVICTDKTGTLTEGVFQLEKIENWHNAFTEEMILQRALMACEIHAVDAMELAIFEKANKFRNSIDGWSLQYDYPFENLGKHMSHVWKNEQTGQMTIAMKGAVEGVLEHCSVTLDEKNKIGEVASQFASQGKRILGLASRQGEFNGDRKHDEFNLIFIGFMIFADPVRSSVKTAIKECQEAGIQIKMLTGDHLLTAHSVADQIGLDHKHEYMGQQLAAMSNEDRRLAYLNGALFARVLPEQKYEMVKELKAHGHVVAMTGDGINDAPALQLADIGISMGKNATDVARSSAKMILMENNFSGIVSAVFEGRQIFANLKRSFSYLMAFHVIVILLALLPPFLKWPPILLPIHVILLEMIVHPISAFSFENIKSSKLLKNEHKNLYSVRQVLSALCSGVLVSLVALLVFYFTFTESILRARALAMAVVFVSNIFLVFKEIYPDQNRRFFITAVILLFITVLFTMTSFMNAYLHFAPII